MKRTPRLGLMLAVLLGSGCGSAPPPPIARRVGGEARVGPFVPPHAYEWYIRAELAVARGDLAAAADAFEQVRTAPDEDPYVLARLVETRDALGQERAASDLLAKAHAMFPDSEALALAASHLAARHGRADEALQFLVEATRLAPESVQPVLELADLLEASGERPRAERVLLDFLARTPRPCARGAEAALRLAILRHDASAIREALARRQLHAPMRSAELLAAARALLEESPANARAALDVLQALPRTPASIPLLVKALLDTGCRARAEAVLALAAESDVGGALSLAAAWLEVGRPALAAQILDNTSDAGESERRAILLGRAELALGRPAEAARAFSSLHPASRRSIEATLGVATALEVAGLPELGREVLAVRVDAESGDVECVQRIARGRALARAGEPARALDALARCSTDAIAARVARAEIVEADGREADAFEAWRSLAPSAAALPVEVRLRAEAESAAASGRIDDAIARLEELTERTPEDSFAAVRLAELLSAAGDSARARQIGATARRFARNPEALARIARVLEDALQE